MISWFRVCVIAVILIAFSSAKSEYRAEVVGSTAHSYIFKLIYTGKQTYYKKPTSPILKQLRFEIVSQTFEDFHFKITDYNRTRFEIPQGGFFPSDPLENFTFPFALCAYRFTYTLNPFDFKVMRKINNGTIFSTYDRDFIFSQHYMEISTQLDTPYIYGLGERFMQNFRKTPGKWTIFNRDRGQVIDKGTGLQTYGYYPFYLNREKAKFFHVNYLRNSNAMDVIVDETKDNRTFVTFKVIGGVLDFRFILGEVDPEGTINKFHIYLGGSQIPPFWGFGMHQCRWGYVNSSMLLNVTEQFKKNDLPLDTIWSDIDYMIDFEDFTIDEKRFPLADMKKITDNYHYIPIIDAGIKINSGRAYTEGVKKGVFIKDANGAELRGWVWPGDTTFVDFFHPLAFGYWSDMLDMLHQKVAFSGIWLDMNQYANFCDGPCDVPTGDVIFDYSKDLPYQPGSDNIESHTIPLNSTHQLGVKQADVHAFGALLETAATSQYLKSINLRPFIISRSSTFGSSKYGFHWTGDNHATWQFLKSSIPEIFNNQLWGMQMVGPDICGFGGDTTQELCARWYQLAALYPFARNHNANDSSEQQPYNLGGNTLKSAKTNIKLRYSLLKHYYSLFLAKRGFGTIFKPLFFGFAIDPNVYVDEIVDTQFLIGNSLMAAPILQQNKTGRSVYFPTVQWYNLHTGQLHNPGTENIQDVKVTDKLPIFLREGSAILMQDTTHVLQVKDLTNTFHLVCGFHKSEGRPGIFTAFTSTLMIEDYNNQRNIQACIKDGCQYTLNIQFKVYQTYKMLNIDVGVVGSLSLMQKIIIDQVTLYHEGSVIHQKLNQPAEITNPTYISIRIDDQNQIQNIIQQIKPIQGQQ